MGFIKNNFISFKSAFQHQSRLQKDVTHDMRNFLQSISSNSEVLSKQIQALLDENLLDQDKLFELIETIKRITLGTSNMNQLIDELEHAHPGVEVVQFEKVNLKILLKNLVESYQNTQSMGIRVYELNFLPDNMMATLCANKILRVVDNLLNNATKYTHEGLIIVQVLDNEHEWCISIKDSGCGIPKQKLDYIFKRFAMGVGKKQQPGSGLGLSIVQHLINLHQGRIEVSSIEGKRTVFKVFIPKNLPIGKFHIPVDILGKPQDKNILLK